MAQRLSMLTAVAVASDLAVIMRFAASSSSSWPSLASRTRMAVCCLCAALFCGCPGSANGWPIARSKLCVHERHLLWLRMLEVLCCQHSKLLKVSHPQTRLKGAVAQVTQSHACFGQSDNCFKCPEHTNRQTHRLEKINYVKDILTLILT